MGDNTVKISQFADNLSAFISDNDSALLLEVTDSFGAYSGLRLNKDKSQVLALGGEWSTVARPLGLKVVDRVKILGLWFSANRSPTFYGITRTI